MKKSKRLLPIILAALMVSAAGCGSADSENEAESKAKTTAAQEKKESGTETETSAVVTEEPEVTNTTEATTTEATATEEPEKTPPQATTNTYYDVGEFTVFVPEGWDAIPVPDYTESFDGTDILTNDILLAKEGEYNAATDEWTYDSGPYFYVTLLNKENYEKVSTSRDYYVEEYGSVKDMEDMTTGSLTWHGFSVNPIGADVYIMWTPAGEGGFTTSISTAYGLSLDDPDVQTILSSIELKG